MRISIPVTTDEGLNSQVAGHFGQAPMFALIDDDTMKCETVPNGSNHAGGALLPPDWLRTQGVELMICQGMGQRAIMLFEQAGIPVHMGQEATVAAMMEAYTSGQLHLATSEDGCAH